MTEQPPEPEELAELAIRGMQGEATPEKPYGIRQAAKVQWGHDGSVRVQLKTYIGPKWHLISESSLYALRKQDMADALKELLAQVEAGPQPGTLP